MLGVRELTVAGIIIRICVAILIGGIIGMERGMKNRPAGLRTYMLVSVGACIVMLINQYAFQVYNVGDPVRLGAQVVSGIGFLGGGTIIVTSHNQIKGLTTAAGLWASACVGLSIGIGLYEVAFVGGAAIYVVLTVLHKWDFIMRNRTQIVDVYVEVDQKISLGVFLRNCRDRDLIVSNINKENDSGYAEDVFAFIATFQGKQKMTQDELVRCIRKLEGVKYMETL